HLECVVPQMVNVARHCAGPAEPEVRGLIPARPVVPESQDPDDGGPGTQPADAMVDSSSQSRPVATQAIFRPEFDADDDDIGLHIADTTPREREKSATRAPVRRLG